MSLDWVFEQQFSFASLSQAGMKVEMHDASASRRPSREIQLQNLLQPRRLGASVEKSFGVAETDQKQSLATRICNP